MTFGTRTMVHLSNILDHITIAILCWSSQLKNMLQKWKKKKKRNRILQIFKSSWIRLFEHKNESNYINLDTIHIAKGQRCNLREIRANINWKVSNFTKKKSCAYAASSSSAYVHGLFWKITFSREEKKSEFRSSRWCTSEKRYKTHRKSAKKLNFTKKGLFWFKLGSCCKNCNK